MPEQHDATRQSTDNPLAVLRHRWPVILLCLLIAGGAAAAFSLSKRKQYSASASLLFRDPALDQKLFGSSFVAPVTDPTREAATNLDLASLQLVAQRTALALDHGLSQSDVSSDISVNPQGQSDVVSITATNPQPRFAAALANTYANQFIAFRRDADRSKVSQARALVQQQLAALSPQQRQGSNGQSLSNRAEQLAILSALQTGNAELVQPATVPTSPSSPSTKRNIAIGAALGLILGLALAFLLHRLDRSVRTPEELAEAYRLPLLGAVPQHRALADDSDLDGTLLPPAAGEAFRMLRARMRYFNVDRDIRSVLITSPAPKDGKSTVAWHLAQTAALSPGSRVILVETDLRRPVIARTHQLRSMPGLAEALTHGVSLKDVIQEVRIGSSNGAGVQASLSVIVAGASPPNPAELIESHKMADLLRSLTDEFDLVIVDTPPSSVVSDAFPMMQQVSGVIVVSSLDQTTRDAAAHLRDQLLALDVHVLGVIANRVKLRRGGYYGYRYYGSDRRLGLDPDPDRPQLEAVGAQNGNASEQPGEPAVATESGGKPGWGEGVAGSKDSEPESRRGFLGRRRT